MKRSLVARRKAQSDSPPSAPSPELKEELGRFCDGFSALAPLPGTLYVASLASEIGELSLVLKSKVLYEVSGGFEPPLIVVVTGGTNVGKSEVFNALIGTEVALPDPRAGMTRQPAIYTHSCFKGHLARDAFLPGASKEVLFDRKRLNATETGETLRAFLWPHESSPWKDLIVIDSPDVDSNRPGNQAWALRLMAVADVIVFVTSPSKYNDEVCVRFLEEAAAMGKEILVAFNLLEEKASKVLEDFVSHVWTGISEEPADVIELPLAREEVTSEMAPPLAPVRERLLDAAADAPAVKAARASGAFDYCATRAGEILAALAREEEALAAIRDRLREAGEGKIEAYRKRVEGEEFLELEEIFKEVLAVFRVPVVDDILAAPRNAFQWLRARITGSGGRGTLEERIRSRREADLQWIKEHVEATRLGLLTTLSESGGGGVEEVLATRLREAGFDRLPTAVVERLAAEGDAGIEAWMRATRDEIVGAIETRPFLKKFLKSARVLLQGGAGVL
ncbi:MAG: GTPase domain-containing protein, partial [Planctomycetota bacterium]